MGMPAYEKIYLVDAMRSLGSMMDIGVNLEGIDADTLFEMFMISGVAAEFQKGNPRYIGGMSGEELLRETFARAGWDESGISQGRTGMEEADSQDPERQSMDKTPEYGEGWIMAYYQWKKGLAFRTIVELGLTMSRIMSMYILHEADVSRFEAAADRILSDNIAKSETRLRKIRQARGYTQKELSEASGVKLRMIQLYEQRENDINKARAGTLYDLSRALGCDMEDLMEPELDITLDELQNVIAI